METLNGARFWGWSTIAPSTPPPPHLVIKVRTLKIKSNTPGAVVGKAVGNGVGVSDGATTKTTSWSFCGRSKSWTLSVGLARISHITCELWLVRQQSMVRKDRKSYWKLHTLNVYFYKTLRHVFISKTFAAKVSSFTISKMRIAKLEYARNLNIVGNGRGISSGSWLRRVFMSKLVASRLIN